MAYTNEGKIEAYLMIDIDSSLSTQISDWISAVDKYIDRYCNRPDGFSTQGVSASVRYFNGNGGLELDIDEFTSITSVEIIEASGGDVEYTLTNGMESDYITYPYNTTPLFRLLLRPTAQIGSWSKGDQRIKVTAVWGHKTSVPKDIELAATMLVASIAEKGIKGGNIRSETLGDYSVTYENLDESANAMNVKRILDTYKLIEL